MLKTFDVILDVEKELHHISMLAFTISQGDLDSVQVTFHLNQDDSAFDLTGKTVQVAIKKPSGLTAYYNCDIVDPLIGESVVLLPQQSYIEYGIYTGELMISDYNAENRSGEMIITTPFYFGSRSAILQAQAEESVNDWTALQQALFNYDKKPVIVTAIPDFAPEYVGQTALDIEGKRAFIAMDETALGWQILGAGEGGGGLVSWNDILGKPLTFPPADHDHAEYLTEAEGDLRYSLKGEGGGGLAEIPPEYLTESEGDTRFQKIGDMPTAHTHGLNDLPASLLTDTEAAAIYQPKGNYLTALPAHTHDFGSITGKPLTYPADVHGHTIGEITGLQAELDSKLETLPDHGHDIADITGLQAELDSKLETLPAHTHAIGDLPAELLTQGEGDLRYAFKGETGTGGGGSVPVEDNLDSTSTVAALSANQGRILDETKAPLDHDHAIADITGLQAELDTKLETMPDHGHDIADITGLQAELDSKLETLPVHTHTMADLPAEILTESEAAAIYQPIGNYQPAGTYLTAIPAEYLTEAEGGALYQPIGTIPDHDHPEYLTAIPAEYLTEAEGDLRYQAIGSATEPAEHTHTFAEITDKPTTLGGYGITDAASDLDLMDHANYQNGEIDRLEGLIGGKADAAHTHTIADLPAELLTESEAAGLYQPKGTYLTALPAHTHAIGDLPAEVLTETEANALYAKTANVYSKTAIDTSLAGKANVTHTHAIGDLPAELLTESEAAGLYQPKGTYLSSIPLMSGAAIGGAQVGNGLAMSGNYLYVKLGAGLALDTTSNAVKVESVDGLSFWKGSQAEYDLITTPDPNTIYYVTG